MHRVIRANEKIVDKVIGNTIEDLIQALENLQNDLSRKLGLAVSESKKDKFQNKLQTTRRLVDRLRDLASAKAESEDSDEVELDDSYGEDSDAHENYIKSESSFTHKRDGEDDEASAKKHTRYTSESK